MHALFSEFGVGFRSSLVTFADGSCVELFSGCDAASDFAFQTQDAARMAAQTLLDQVFINSPLGNFDDDPTKTFGCSVPNFCMSLIPFGATERLAQTAFSQNTPLLDSVEFIQMFKATEVRSFGFFNYAVFSASTSAVPEPATWAMTIGGFGMVGGAMRFARRRQKVTVSYA